MSNELELRSPAAPGLGAAAALSIGAGVIHAAMVGVHAEHPTLARLFIAAAVFQIGWGLVALTRPNRLLALVGALGNAGAFSFWLTTRLTGVSIIDGLESSEAASFVDTTCALLGLAAALTAAMVFVRRDAVLRAFSVAPFALVAAALTVPAMVAGADHNAGGHDTEAAGAEHAGEDHAVTGEQQAVAGEDQAATTREHAAGEEQATGEEEQATGEEEHAAAATDWPRPYDPAKPLDIDGVKGVSGQQQAWATALIDRTQKDLPMYASTDEAYAAGYRSIGDADTGVEHYINYSYLADGVSLDPTKAESLVYQVDGKRRTLVSAMFIAEPEYESATDPDLTELAGPLITWHTHENLCWTGGEDGPIVVGTADRQEDCPEGSVLTGGGKPMAHVWIAPHECGPFAALEGHGAGQVGDGTATRTDVCSQGHHADGEEANAGKKGDPEAQAVAPKPYDPKKPIDLGGVDGVSPEQQARAENLIAITLNRLPRYASTDTAYADGFRSIGDAATGYEHYINWSYINDEHELNPDFPESLVYQADPETGERTLVSVMFLLSNDKNLDNSPDIGGSLTQWHVHENLCFSADPAELPTDQPAEVHVVGLTNGDGTCGVGVKLRESPMIHVWIIPQKCGPFSALDGIGAGQVKPGEEQACDEAHGSH